MSEFVKRLSHGTAYLNDKKVEYFEIQNYFFESGKHYFTVHLELKFGLDIRRYILLLDEKEFETPNFIYQIKEEDLWREIDQARREIGNPYEISPGKFDRYPVIDQATLRQFDEIKQGLTLTIKMLGST